MSLYFPDGAICHKCGKDIESDVDTILTETAMWRIWIMDDAKGLPCELPQLCKSCLVKMNKLYRGIKD